jgi:ankyrin repeat protein
MKKLLCMLTLLSSTVIFSMLPPKTMPCTEGKTPLMLAVLKISYLDDTFLKEQEPTINYQDAHGRTALHYAAANSDKVAIAILVQHGADRTLKDREGKTAEEISIERNMLRARNDDRSYDHCDEQTPDMPSHDDDSKPTLTSIYTPRSPINLRNEYSDEVSSPKTSSTKNQHKPSFTDYASLI